jgi:hypothetical protein
MWAPPILRFLLMIPRIFYLFSHGVRLSQLGTVATVRSIVPAPRWEMRKIVGQTVGCELAGEIEAIGENLPQIHFIHHKSHMIWPVFEPGRWEGEGWEAGD